MQRMPVRKKKGDDSERKVACNVGSAELEDLTGRQ